MSATAAQQICEDLAGVPCDNVELEIPQVPKNWSPLVVGTPLVIVYLDAEGLLATHEFIPAELFEELQNVPDADELPDELVDQVEETAPFLLADPRGEFIFITKAQVTDLGIENIEE